MTKHDKNKKHKTETFPKLLEKMTKHDKNKKHKTEFFPQHYVKSYLNYIGANICLQSIAQLFLCLILLNLPTQ
jgi:hypothetical protein